MTADMTLIKSDTAWKGATVDRLKQLKDTHYAHFQLQVLLDLDSTRVALHESQLKIIIAYFTLGL